MTENLIRNGGFEADWAEESSHQCIVFSPTAGPSLRQIGNIFVPPRWTFWFWHDPRPTGQEGQGYDQPEGRDAHSTGDVRRVHSGTKAYTYFTMWRRHDAGLFQQVAVTKGRRYSMAAWAHAWSSDDDNPYTSESASGPFSAFEGDPGLNSDLINFTFTLGIDPSGGLDPRADTVIWGQGAHNYNAHTPVPGVVVEAQADKITVFLRSVTEWPFKHNDAYWDDVELVALDEPTPEPPPEPTPGPGMTPEPYERTYFLLPPGVGAAWARAVVAATWDTMRPTIGGSADDAGLRDPLVTRRRVVAINPAAWQERPGAQTLEEWFDEHYPGVEFVPVRVATPGDLARKLREMIEKGEWE